MRWLSKAGRRAAGCRLALALLVVGALGWAGPAAAQEPGGWFDGLNRKMFELNRSLRDGMEAVREAMPDALSVPDWVAEGAGNALSNAINEPITALSHALTGRFDHAGTSLKRFGINMTQGVLGTSDVATGMGIVVPRTDIGLALCQLGVADGPYVMLPMIGPRTLRDATADIVITTAVVYVALIPVLGPAPGLMAIVVIEVLDGFATAAMARQIDAADVDGDFDAVRDRYLAARAQRCAGT